MKGDYITIILLVQLSNTAKHVFDPL